MTPATAPEARVLGDFILRDKIGEGGFGTVYRAEQRGLDRPAVIKVIRRSIATNKTAIERFVLEAKLASRFDHPYAAHVYAFGAEPDGLLWIAMEHVRGTPLNELIAQSGPMPVDRFLPFMERLCEAIQAAHDQGIIHRDIKPSNVMVIARSGRLIPKLLDFGIAKLIEGDEVVPKLGRNQSPRAHRPTDPSIRPSASSITAATNTPAELEHTAAAAAGDRSAGSLTIEGQILGSPIYMAPEQWLDASRVGPWTDQYALAMLAFEVLTGTKAFSGTTIAELLVAHTQQPLPALPNVPVAVHAVLARAAAKEYDERFANLDDLAAALRAAIAPVAEVEARVELPAELLATWIADAPRPLADALATVATSRSPVRVADRVMATAGGIARWLGALAIACRSRVGKLDKNTEAAAIRELRRRPLRDEEWLDLAVALIAPFVTRAETWPLPELVSMLAGGDAVAALRALVRGETPLVVVAGSVEYATAVAKLAQLVVVLEGLAWLLDYELAREVPGGLELWMGTASDEPVIRPDHHADAAGRIVMLDADGARVVVLSPIVCVAAPAAGEAEQMFALAGPGRADDTARYVASPRGFELETDDTWTWIGANVLELSAAATRAADDERSPYPGLTSFTGDDHASFVGREREVAELVNRLRTQPMVVVVGPSGVGKSSFLAAGVARSLPASWTAHIVRPGSDPLATLASIVDRESGSPYRGDRRAEPTREPRAIADALATMAERLGETLVIIVDQAEELFTMCADEAARAGFADVLATASHAPNIRVLLGVRDDFLCRVEDLAAWRGGLARAVQILRVPGVDELERIIAVPARRRGFEFDDPTLPRAIANAVADRPGALPLLAFTVAELWDQRDRHFNRLTRAAYERIGGVTGALVQHADGMVDQLSVADRRLVRLAFRRLLTADGTRALIGRADLIAALGATPAATHVVERLLSARLIVSRDDDAGERVEIVHEALVTTWPKLAAWRLEDDAGVRMHQQLATAATHWHERGRAADLLWRGEALADLRRWRAHSELAATAIEAAFADASEAAARTSRRRRIGILGGAFAVLGTGVAVLGGMNHVVSNQRADALHHLAANLEERGRSAIASDDAARGLLYLTEAHRLGETGPASDLLIARATSEIEAQSGLAARQANAIAYARFDALTAVFVDTSLTAQVWDRSTRATTSAPIAGIRDAAPLGTRVVMIDRQGDVIVTERDGSPRWRADKAHAGIEAGPHLLQVGGSAAGNVAISYGPTARLWSADDGHARGELVSGAPIVVAAFDRSGRRVATGDAAGALRIWDTATAALLTTCQPHGAEVYALAFSADGAILASGSKDNNVQVCDAATGALVRRFEGHTNSVLDVDVAPDGRTIASAATDHTARIWDLATGKLAARLDGHPGSVTFVRFSPDGSYLATAGMDSTVRIWDAAAGTLVASLQGGAATPIVDWEASSRAVMTAGYDGTIRRWDLDRALLGRTTRPHASTIEDLQISADGRWSISAAADGVTIWDLATNTAHASVPGETIMARLAPDGRALVTTTASGTATLYSVPDATPIRTLATGVTVAAFAPDGATIVTGGRDHAVRMWSREGAELGSVAIDFAPEDIDFDPGSKFVIVHSRFGDPASKDAPVIDLASHQIATRLRGAHTAPFTVAVDGTRVATSDGIDIRLFELGTWRELGVLVGHKSAVSVLGFLPDGRLVSGSDDRLALIWSREGQLVFSLATGGSRVTAIAAARDGSVFATGSEDGAVRVWDPTTYSDLLTLASHRGKAMFVSFTPDGRWLQSGGTDGRVVTWDLRRPSRSLADLDHLIRCRVPLRFDGDELLPRDLDFDDPSCR